MLEQLAHAQHRQALPGVPSGVWQIDPAHSIVGFSVRHLMSKVRGTFTEYGGQITVADDQLRSSAEVEVALASVYTGNEMRDGHLRTSDFFDVEQHPTMRFVSLGLREANGTWVLDGELTIRGTTRDVEIGVEFLGYDPTGQQGEPRIGFEGRTSIHRSDFGITFGLDGGKIVVGDKIDILLNIEATLAD